MFLLEQRGPADRHLAGEHGRAAHLGEHLGAVDAVLQLHPGGSHLGGGADPGQQVGSDERRQVEVVGCLPEYIKVISQLHVL